MTSTLTEIVGAVAAVLTTLCWVPQMVKIVRTRHTQDLSLWTQAVFAAGILLWLVYGVLIDSWPIVGANAVTIVLVGIILWLKLRYG